MNRATLLLALVVAGCGFQHTQPRAPAATGLEARPARLVQSIPIERTPAVHIVEVPQDAFETVRCVVVVTEAGVSAACPTKGIDLTDPATP